MNLYFDRTDAGQALAKELIPYAEGADNLVLALPRGGVPVGLEVARRLHAPLDVFLTRKLSVPDFPELALGAISSGGVLVLNDELMEQLSVSPLEMADSLDRETAALRRQLKRYRRGNEPPKIAGTHVFLVADGLATGASMRAALIALRTSGPARITVAVPVGAAEPCEKIAAEVAKQVRKCESTKGRKCGNG